MEGRAEARKEEWTGLREEGRKERRKEGREEGRKEGRPGNLHGLSLIHI